MSTPATNLVRKLWQYCNVLRDDGLSYPDYVEQLTYLLFLKLSDEQKDGPVPEAYSWASFAGKSSDSLHRHYSRVLTELGKRDGMLGVIFRNAKNKIKDPAKLRLLIEDLIGQTEWTTLSTDLKGDAYEGLLEKNARDTKSGAGQYFTPRGLIETIVTCVDPRPLEIICDPACGTAGFLLATHTHVRRQLISPTAAQRRHLALKALRGVELVEEVARLATMNLLLHGIGTGANNDELPIRCDDSLKGPSPYKVDVVLTNPPFGVKGSVKFTQRGRGGKRDELTVERPEFWVPTANKQLNFLQHVVTMLKPGGRAAIIVPDNVLFESGAASVIRRRLLETCDVHTLLRLPRGLFYAQGVKANVLFFDLPTKKTTTPSRTLWVYDFRGSMRFSVKTKPLAREDLEEFIRCYRPGDRGGRTTAISPDSATLRWKPFQTEALLNTDLCGFDLTWRVEPPRDAAGTSARLAEISRLISADLERALQHVSRTLPS